MAPKATFRVRITICLKFPEKSLIGSLQKLHSLRLPLILNVIRHRTISRSLDLFFIAVVAQSALQSIIGHWLHADPLRPLLNSPRGLNSHQTLQSGVTSILIMCGAMTTSTTRRFRWPSLWYNPKHDAPTA